MLITGIITRLSCVYNIYIIKLYKTSSHLADLYGINVSLLTGVKIQIATVQLKG